MGRHRLSRPDRYLKPAIITLLVASSAFVTIQLLPGGGTTQMPESLRGAVAPHTQRDSATNYAFRDFHDTRRPVYVAHHHRITAPSISASTSPPVAPVPPVYASTQAGKAVAYAYAQLGCPYVWGGTGPCSSGFDCSGLVMEAWAYAGVSIPRTTWAQESLPQVPISQMEPGDLMIMFGGAHVAMYVGHGEMIQAPMPGQLVQLTPIAGWPLQNTIMVVRP